MTSFRQWYRSGQPWMWMTAGCVSLSLLAVLGLMLMIGMRGLAYFWPADIHRLTVQTAPDNSIQVIGEIYRKEWVSAQQLMEAGVELPDNGRQMYQRFLVKTGNRERLGMDFRWVLDKDIQQQDLPVGVSLAVIERQTNGNFYGFVSGLEVNDSAVDLSQLSSSLARVDLLNEQQNRLQRSGINNVNYQLQQLRLERRELTQKKRLDEGEERRLLDREKQLTDEYRSLENELNAVRAELLRDTLIIRDMQGEQVPIPLATIVGVYYPNDMSFWQRLGYFFSRIGEFVSGEPREANTEGGIFPAIFGTVLMVLLMSVVVTPLGVVAALYLHEYAGNNWLTRTIRIAVINLAGVPSIVYGVFGLGFFVYLVGGSIDQAFYTAALPGPTFGTPGVLWSALTLAILTLPVVIVSTEEGLSRIPTSFREGSQALGATKAETIWRIVLPMASPAIMTGLILAVARAAGEVAPLMLVGVVKSVSALPIDGNFPFLHLDRKFMHLGFHIYDVGFQSPNVEAARPLVYATATLLVTVIVGLNITAIGIRNHLREKYRAIAQ